MTDLESLQLPSEHVVWLTDEKDKSAEEILELEEKQWQSISRQSINLGKQDAPVWVKFSLRNKNDEPLKKLLKIRRRNQTEIDLYIKKHGQAGIEHYPAGLVTPPE